MTPRNAVGALAVTLLTAALLTSHIPTAVVGGALLAAVAGRAHTTEGPRP